MNAIKRLWDFWRKLPAWIVRYPATSFRQRCYILFDYLHLYRTKGLLREEYYEFEFEKRDAEFRKNFLGQNEQRHYLNLLNPIKYFSLARNKYLTHCLLEKAGVRKSELYCYYQPEGRVSGGKDVASTVADVCRILSSKNVLQCVIKDTERSHGEGVIVVEKIEYLEGDCRLHRFNANTLLLSEILGKHPLIFEGLIRQTKQLASLNPSSINTVRFMTALHPNGEATIIASFIKIGRAGSCVDNAGEGGNVDVCIDTPSGRMEYAVRYDGWRNIHEIDKHPDSKAQLNGIVIENWEQIKADVIGFQQVMPWCKAAGWDIAITDEGPLVIEVNDFWDRTGQYFIRRGWRKEIRECYKEWEAAGLRYPIPRLRQYISPLHLRAVMRRS